MLIMTRRVDEILHIGDDTTVTVLGVKGNQVRLGVTAPREVPVDRSEIRARKVRELQRMQRLTVYDCTFERNGSTLHAEIAADSETELNAYLQQQYPGIELDSLNIEISWAPDLLLLVMSGLLDPADYATYNLLRHTLTTCGNKTPCVLLPRNEMQEAA